MKLFLKSYIFIPDRRPTALPQGPPLTKTGQLALRTPRHIIPEQAARFSQQTYLYDNFYSFFYQRKVKIVKTY